MTGQVQAASMTQSQFKAMACQGLQAILTCGNVMIDVQTAASFDSINTASPTITFDKNGNVTNSWKFDPGGSGDIVIMRMMYIWSMPNGPLGFSISNLNASQRLLIATAVAKTEPY